MHDFKDYVLKDFEKTFDLIDESKSKFAYVKEVPDIG